MNRFDLTHKELASLTWTQGGFWLHTIGEDGIARASFGGRESLENVRQFALARGIALRVIERGCQTVYPGRSARVCVEQEPLGL